MTSSSHALTTPVASNSNTDAGDSLGSSNRRPRLVPRRDAMVVRILDENRSRCEVRLGDRLRKIGL